MYSAGQRAKTIETFAGLGVSTADTIAELSYPSRVTLHNFAVLRQALLGNRHILTMVVRMVRIEPNRGNGRGSLARLGSASSFRSLSCRQLPSWFLISFRFHNCCLWLALISATSSTTCATSSTTCAWSRALAPATTTLALATRLLSAQRHQAAAGEPQGCAQNLIEASSTPTEPAKTSSPTRCCRWYGTRSTRAGRSRSSACIPDQKSSMTTSARAPSRAS